MIMTSNVWGGGSGGGRIIIGLWALKTEERKSKTSFIIHYKSVCKGIHKTRTYT